jgi:deoxyribonuclease IV
MRARTRSRHPASASNALLDRVWRCTYPQTVILGAHCSTAGGLHKALERATTVGASSCQIFVKNNMQWFGKPYQPLEIAQYQKALASSQVKAVFGHAGYLINIAAPPSENRDKSIKSLVQEVELATQIGLPFLVLHPGAHLGSGEEAGMTAAAQALNEVFRVTRNSRVRIALENTAGQGTCLGCRLPDLAGIYERVDHPERLGICLDTAHFLAAGYDIRTPKGWDSAIQEVKALVGLKEILGFHLNDSKADLGSHVDRHAHIGLGKIGLGAFGHIVNDARFQRRPGCLETPKSDDLHEDVENLKALRSLVNGAVVTEAVPPSPAAAKNTRSSARPKPKAQAERDRPRAKQTN